MFPSVRQGCLLHGKVDLGGDPATIETTVA